MRSSAGLTMLLCLMVTPAAAQDPAATLARIQAEGTAGSHVGDLFFHLTDGIGARLTGSDSYREAAEWARDTMDGWGLENARLESFDFGRGWELERFSLEMTEPRYMPLIAYPEAWTPSTDGVVSGPVVYLGDRTIEQVDAMLPQLRGAIVVAHLPQEEYVRQDRPQPAGPESSVRTGSPPVPRLRSAVPLGQLMGRLQQAGAAALLRPSPHEHGTVLVLGNRGTSDDAVPVVVLAAEQYNLLARLAATGEAPEVRLELRTEYQGASSGNGINVLAEIPGSDPELSDEVVLVGAHLDSWHTSNGATDNGDGAVTVLEAMRILASMGERPRRTIRAALWGGEEQGLLGARAYIAEHLRTPADRDRITVYLNDDPGTGATYGFYMQDNAAAMAMFDGWLEPLRDLGARRNVIEGIGSTDHVPFDEIGIPAFTAIKDFADYDVRSRHTNVDFLERVAVEDLQQSAIVLASMAWQAAMEDEGVPR